MPYTLNITTIIGARPQFIKASVVSHAFHKHNLTNANQIKETIIHTGQHFDRNMSQVFFEEMDIPKPDYNLNISGISHGAMTGRMIEGIELILIDKQPDLVLIYGDTNSTLAASLAASKINIKIAHIEAGLRSFNMKMPEEVNRILSERVSDYLFCPTDTAVKNLREEGITEGVYKVGDVMYDANLFYKKIAFTKINLKRWNLKENNYILLTLHRAENTGKNTRLRSIFEAINKISEDIKIIMPVHPRTKKVLNALGDKIATSGITFINPVSYLEMIRLEMSAKAIFTDSGGVQKEAFFLKVPCLTLRDQTEWVETVVGKNNQIVGADTNKIINAYNNMSYKDIDKNIFGDGNTSEKIKNIITQL